MRTLPRIAISFLLLGFRLDFNFKKIGNNNVGRPERGRGLKGSMVDEEENGILNLDN